MSSRQLRLRSLSKRLAEPSVWQAMLSIAVLVVVIGVAATVRRPVSIGPGNPKHDFFSGPLIESRQQSGLVAKPYWDRVRIALTIKSNPANPPHVLLRVRDSRTKRIVRESTATIPARRTYPTEPLWVEFQFRPIEDRFPATIEVFVLDDEEAHRLFIGTSRGDRFEAGSLIPFEPATGDQDLTFVYEGPESLVRHGGALVEHFMKQASGSSIAIAWALVISSFVCLAALVVGLAPPLYRMVGDFTDIPELGALRRSRRSSVSRGRSSRKRRNAACPTRPGPPGNRDSDRLADGSGGSDSELGEV